MQKAKSLLKLTIILIFLSLFLFNCGSSDSSPSERESAPTKSSLARRYYSKLVNYQRPIESRLRALNISIGRKSPGRIKSSLASVQDETTRIADLVSKIEGFEGDTTLRDAFLDLLEFYESIFSVEAQEIVDLLSNNPDDTDGIEFAIDGFNRRITEEGQDLEREFEEAKETFLRRYRAR